LATREWRVMSFPRHLRGGGVVYNLSRETNVLCTISTAASAQWCCTPCPPISPVPSRVSTNKPGRSTSHRVSRPCTIGLQAVAHPINPSCDRGRLLGSSGSSGSLRRVTTVDAGITQCASAMIGRARHEMAAVFAPLHRLIEGFKKPALAGLAGPWRLHRRRNHSMSFNLLRPAGAQRAQKCPGMPGCVCHGAQGRTSTKECASGFPSRQIFLPGCFVGPPTPFGPCPRPCDPAPAPRAAPPWSHVVTIAGCRDAIVGGLACIGNGEAIDRR
jgi:hypothetical protein